MAKQNLYTRTKPNILVIWGDDIGWFNISANNNGIMGYRTPNIDRIAKEGALFTDWYGEQGCTAGRAAFITGQYPIRTGLTKVGLPGADLGLQPEDPTIADVLKPLGYVTGQFGKNHLGDRDEFLPTVHGFDEFFGNLYHLNAEEEPENPDYPKDPEFRKKFGPRGVLHCVANADGTQKIKDTGPLTRNRMETVDEEFLEASLAFIENAVRNDKPFFCWWNSTRMHIWTHLKKESEGVTGLGVYPDGMVEHDGHVGKLLDKLDELGIADNTIVMYSTDNGARVMSWPDGGCTPFRGEKDTNFEGGFRVPCAIRWPGVIKPGTVSNEIFSHTDMLPTLAAAAGEPDAIEKLKKGYKSGNKTFKVHIDGYNLLPFFKGEVKENPRKGFLYLSDDNHLMAVRVGNWKVTFMEQRAHGLGIWGEPFVSMRVPHMHNLRTDPFERASEDASLFYDKWKADRAFLLVPVQAIVEQFLKTFAEFPPRQNPASFSIDQALEKARGVLAMAQGGSTGSQVFNYDPYTPGPSVKAKEEAGIGEWRELGPEPSPPEPVVPRVTCHFHAEMDAEVIVKGVAFLFVTISREIIKTIISATSSSGKAELDPAKQILIRVIPKSNFIIIDESEGRAEIQVPQPNKPQPLVFELRATEEGEGEVWVMVRQGQVCIVKLILKPKVVKTRSLSSAKVTAEKSASEPKQPSKPLHQLWIEENKTEGGFVYNFDIYSPGLKINRRFKSSPLKGDREKYVADLYKQIEDRWISTKRDKENFVQELRAFGVDLFDELIPAELQKLLWERRHDFDNIQVISNEPFIPWELVHLKDPSKRGMPDETKFLGQMGLIRWLEGAGENGWPPDEIKLRKGRIRYVIPKYPLPEYELPEAEEEEGFLKKEFTATPVKPESGEVRKIISRPGEFDLLHFACHGVAESSSITDAKLLMQGRVEENEYIIDPFTATITAKFSSLKADDNAPMVVLNACQTGRRGYKLTCIGGFAHAFLSGGAGAFIGALWSVGDGPARTFTETLYKALLSSGNLSEATIQARKAAEDAGDATWLAYVVYGHPHLLIGELESHH